MDTTVPLSSLTGTFQENDLINYVTSVYFYRTDGWGDGFLRPGVGYWVKFANDVNFTFNGPAFTSTNQNIYFPSNTITSFALMLPSEILLTSLPGNYQQNDIFNYVTSIYIYQSSGWSNTGALKPGVGYWVKTQNLINETLSLS